MVLIIKEKKKYQGKHRQVCDRSVFSMNKEELDEVYLGLVFCQRLSEVIKLEIRLKKNWREELQQMSLQKLDVTAPIGK